MFALWLCANGYAYARRLCASERLFAVFMVREFASECEYESERLFAIFIVCEFASEYECERLFASQNLIKGG